MSLLLRSSVFICGSLIAAVAARGTTITVDTTADDTTLNGNCTLREAVIAANTNAAVDACTAGGLHDIVVATSGTYVLTLAGAGEDAAATGDLDIRPGGNGTISVISGNLVRVSDGGSGGGIHSFDGSLSITDSTITDNSVERVNGGNPVYGGGIACIGYSMTITRSTIDGNSTIASYSNSLGGGISFDNGTAIINSSTISRNSASGC